MKKPISLAAAALTLLLCLTACTGNRNTVNPAAGTTDLTEDQHYTADSSGRTNEAGDDGRSTGSSSAAAGDNGTTNAASNNGTMAGERVDGRSTVADNVRGAVNEAGEVVDDVADGAADIVDRVTDTVQDNSVPERSTRRP